jgi:CheY-like chemotaxis protein
MAHLIEDLLDLSRIGSGKMRIEDEPIDLGSVVQAAVESARPAAEGKGLRLEADVKSGPGHVRGDAARLQQVVGNLVANAVKFTPRGGCVAVNLRSHGSHAELAVSDTGKGIDPTFLPHVFEPFRQGETDVARAGGGLGLGLAIVKQLVECHGGEVEARSEGSGRGATFIVRLPLEVAPASQTHPIATRHDTGRRASGPVRIDGVRVLLVEDDEDMRDLLHDVLSSSGACVIPAASVEEAMRCLAREVPDVLVSDVGMPGESGFDLIRRVRALPTDAGGRIPAAALTAYTRGQDRSAALDAGFALHIPKPVEAEELCAAVAMLARRRDDTGTIGGA